MNVNKRRKRTMKRTINVKWLPMWLVPMVSSKLSLVYCRRVSLKLSASPALLTSTDSCLPVAWNSSTNFLTDSRSARSSCTRQSQYKRYMRAGQRAIWRTKHCNSAINVQWRTDNYDPKQQDQTSAGLTLPTMPTRNGGPSKPSPPLLFYPHSSPSP